jgi:60 kDa SS-A/Ro ribonucleoprotein
MSGYLKNILAAASRTPQSEPLPGQIANSAGGYSYGIDKWSSLRRFLILGTEGGTYYINERKLTTDGLRAVEACIDEDHGRVLRETIEISARGLAPKNDFAILVMAMLVSRGAEDDRRDAAYRITDVCRTGTHLFQFCDFVENFRGWGRMLRDNVSRWYETKDAKALAYQVLKYRQRGGWTHRDVLRKAHPEAVTSSHASIYNFVCGREWDREDENLAQIAAFETTNNVEAKAHQVTPLIRSMRMTREMITPDLLTDPDVLTALTERAPMTALIRNLGNMTRHGVLKPNSDLTQGVIERITDEGSIMAARVHPFNILVALKTYASGGGMLGRNTWSPIPKIVSALDDAYYKAFINIEPTNTSWLLGLDVSGSMHSGLAGGLPLTPGEAAFAMASITERVEERVITMGFSSGFTPLDFSGKRLDDIMRDYRRMPFDSTDCSLPMRYAIENELKIDAFAVYTDNETWAGDEHPVETLREYRRKSGIDAKLIVVGMVTNEFTIADPSDGGMLDVVGLDASTPQMIAAFGAGEM